MKRAGYYARVSTEKQKDEETIENQINEIKAAIKEDKNVLVVGCEYKDDGWSGAILERPALDTMRQDARDGKFDILYVYDRGRLARKFLYQGLVIEELENLRIEFKSLHDINGNASPEEILMGNVMGVFHEYERLKITERFRIGKLSKVGRGELLGYQPAYGYDYTPIKRKANRKVKNGFFTINEDEAKVVRLMFNWVSIECVSLKEVIRRLYDLGIPPKKGKRQMWCNSSVVRMLRNETYTGRHYYYKSESIVSRNPHAKSQRKYQNHHSLKTSRRVRDKGEWLEVKVPRIISHRLFDSVQKQLKLNSKYSPRCKKNPYLFGGLIHCPCGSKRTGEGHDGHYYYRCINRLMTFPEPRTCFESGVNVRVLDLVGWQHIAALLSNPELLEKQLKRYGQVKAVDVSSQSNKNDISRSLKALDEEERRFTKAFGLGGSQKVFTENMDRVSKQRLELKRQLVEPNTDELDQIKSLDTDAFTESFKAFLADLTYEDKLFTVRQVVDRVEATKELVIICGNIPIPKKISGSQVGLRVNNRHRRFAECREIDAV